MKNMKCITTIGLAALTCASALAQAVLNGSFERGVDLSHESIQLDAPDSTSIRHWNLTNGTIDYIGTRWRAAHGRRCLDLSGVSAGTISQSIRGLQRGKVYQLTFFLAGNPEDGPEIKKVRVTIAGKSYVFSHSIRGASARNMRWREKRILFRAPGQSTTLEFKSLEDGWAGAALDAVAIKETWSFR